MNKLITFITVVLFFTATTIKAQVPATIVKEGNYSVSETDTVTVTATQSITLKPNTWIHVGSSFVAKIGIDNGTNPDSGNNPTTTNPSTDQNYIITTTYKQPTTPVFVNSDPSKANVNITYFDGLGRPIQQIGNQQSATGKDVIIHIEYDGFGRQTK
jgi:hypothetical protein